MTWITDSAASERIAADPVSKYAAVLPNSITAPNASERRIASRVSRKRSGKGTGAATVEPDIRLRNRMHAHDQARIGAYAPIGSARETTGAFNPCIHRGFTLGG